MSTTATFEQNIGSIKGSRTSGLLQQHKLTAYFALTLAFSWAVELPLVASVQGWMGIEVPMAVHYLAAFGPMLAAVLVTWGTDGSGGVRELFGRVAKWRVGVVGIIFAVGSPLLLFAAAAVAGWAMNGVWPDLYLLGQVSYMPYLGVGVLPLWIITYGFGEEIGWRGFALPRLQNGRSALIATIILGAMWTVWHMPPFFYLESYMQLGLSILPMFVLSVLAAAVVFTWLYNSTGGSVLMVAIWHAVFDLLSAGKVSDSMMQAIMSAAIMVWAVVIVIVFKPANLSRTSKHTL